MIKETQAFKTSDGCIFAIKDEAEAHEYVIHKLHILDWFITQQEDYTDRGKVTATRIIGDFLDTLKAASIEIPEAPYNEAEETS